MSWTASTRMQSLRGLPAVHGNKIMRVQQQGSTYYYSPGLTDMPELCGIIDRRYGPISS